MSSIPWTPDNEDARRLLNERIDTYDVDESLGLWDRFVRWLYDALSINADPTGPGSFVILALLIAAVAILVLLLVRFFRPPANPDANAENTDLVDPSVAAEEYLNSAQRYFAEGQFGQAYIHAYRFMVRHAQQRQLVEVTPSTTATTFGWSLGAVLAPHREAINHASLVFNQIVYGGSDPSEEAVATMLQLAQTIETAQPQAAHPDHDPARLIPR